MTQSKSGKWLVKASHEDTVSNSSVREVAEALGLRLPTAQLLFNRGCDTPEKAQDFIEKRNEQLHDPFLMRDMRKAGEKILETVKNGEKIVIYGDYDVDGVTSVTILYMYLRDMGADVGYYIPSRLGEGYGMSETSLRRLSSEGCKLIITVDMGITSFEEAGLIGELGMELIVTDHHECHNELPEAYAVVNPKQPSCKYPFKELAGVGVVYKLVSALEMLRFPVDGMYQCIKRVSDKYIDLVAIGTVADVMPLRDENRLIVERGLSIIENNPRTSLASLIEAARGGATVTKKAKVNSAFVGYTIAPRINAAGRIRSASIAVELFLAEEKEKADELSAELCEINSERQIEENKIIEQAFEKINAEHDFEHDPVIVLTDESWHHGIIGIVASRITERYSRPCILISFDDVGDGSGTTDGTDSDVGKGSGRSIKGMNLVDALTHCDDLLVKYGGHELAAGLSIERGKLDEFKVRINDFARGCFDSAHPVAAIEAECELVPRDVDLGFAIELNKLEPYGVTNPVPVFIMRNMRVSKIMGLPKKNTSPKHTSFILTKDCCVVEAIFFRKTPYEFEYVNDDEVDVIFNLDINEHDGERKLQFKIKDIRPSEAIWAEEEKEKKLYFDINNGTADIDSMSREEISSIVPVREDCKLVYNALSGELRRRTNDLINRSADTSTETKNMFGIRTVSKLLGGKMRYAKIMYIIRIFQELNILSVNLIDKQTDTYFIDVYKSSKEKTSIDKSNILKKLKAQFAKNL